MTIEANRRLLVLLLNTWGLDATRISAGNVGPDGYEELVFDGFGHRTIDADGGLATIRKPWPPGFPYEEQFLGFFRAAHLTAPREEPT